MNEQATQSVRRLQHLVDYTRTMRAFLEQIRSIDHTDEDFNWAANQIDLALVRCVVGLSKTGPPLPDAHPVRLLMKEMYGWEATAFELEAANAIETASGALALQTASGGSPP